MKSDSVFRPATFTPAIARPAARPARKPLRRALSLAADRLLDWFAGSTEPQISRRVSRSGDVRWRVFDPVSGRSALLSSEAEVRAWLDSRYSR